MSESNTKDKKILIIDYDGFKIIHNITEEEQNKINKAFKDFQEIFKTFSIDYVIEPTGIIIDEMIKINEQCNKINLEKLKEKHFEKFNYKIKRGKRKWR